MNTADNGNHSNASCEDLVYEAAEGASDQTSPTLSIYADRATIRSILKEDAQAAGLRVGRATDLAPLCEPDARPLSDVVLIDSPVVEASTLAALVMIDQRAARSGTRLIISTTVEALDDVFGCMDQSQAQILVNPDRAERVMALGQVLAQFPSARLRELSEDERHMLLRLTEQVGQIAGRIDRLASSPQTLEEAAESPWAVMAAPEGLVCNEVAGGGPNMRTTRPPLPDARLVRRIIRHRQLRSRYFDTSIFADPAWDMLLDLSAARVEHRRVSVSSLCIASGVPPTTALRWIGQMVEQGLFARVGDRTDRRRAFIELTDRCADSMARYFAEVGSRATLI